MASAMCWCLAGAKRLSRNVCAKNFFTSDAYAPCKAIPSIDRTCCLARRIGFRFPHLVATRCYSSSGGGGGADLRGVVMYLQNPVKWLVKRWNIYQVQTKLDPEFSVDDFLTGAKQAVSLLTQLISKGDSIGFQHLVENGARDDLKHIMSLWPQEHRAALGLEVDDILSINLRKLDIYNINDKKQVFADIICFGFKRNLEIPYIIEVSLRFSRDFQLTPPGDWIITAIMNLNVKQLNQ